MLDPRDFLEALQIKIESVSGHNLIFSCPFHGSDRHPSARMHAETGVWLCSSCHLKGNITSFLAKLRDIPYADAKKNIEDRYGVEVVSAGGDLSPIVRRNLGLDIESPLVRVAPSESWVSVFMHSWENSTDGQRALQYMLGRGFTREILDRFGIGFDSHTKRVTIPVRDVDGELVGFKARAIDKDTHPRYLILGGKSYGFGTYSKSEHVYGLQQVMPTTTILCEGELNVVALMQKTGWWGIGVAGSEFSERQRQLIVERCHHVIVWFDDDDAGQRGMWKVVESLYPYTRVDIVAHSPRDAAELDAEQIRELLGKIEPALTSYTRAALPDRLVI